MRRARSRDGIGPFCETGVSHNGAVRHVREHVHSLGYQDSNLD